MFYFKLCNQTLFKVDWNEFALCIYCLSGCVASIFGRLTSALIHKNANASSFATLIVRNDYSNETMKILKTPENETPTHEYFNCT